MRSLRGSGARILVSALLTATWLVAVGCGATNVFASDKLYLPDPNAQAVTLHVEVTDAGYSPREVRVPAGRSIQLILRNRTTDEVHYKVEGLYANQILWLVQPKDMVREEGVSDDDHEHHHDKEFVNFRGTSAEGIKPNQKEVHLYAGRTSVDVIHFYALKPGSYDVVDPLHPKFKGKLTVYAP